MAAGALLLTMLTWSLASPLGSTHDEWFHLGSIWCANGVDGKDCTAFNEPGESGYYTGVAAIEDGSCFLDNPAEVSRCKTAAASSYPANFKLYPSTYYKVMNLFVSEHPTLSVLAMRLFNGMLGVLLLSSVLLLSNGRQRMAWLTGYTFTLLPMTMYLTASVHPSGWAVTGVGTSWIFLHIAITAGRSNRRKLGWAWALWAVSTAMVFASRYDAFMFLLFSNFVVLVITLNVFQRLRLRYLAGLAALAVIALYLTSRVNGMVSWIFEFPLTERVEFTKTSTWLSHWIMQTIWVPVQSLGIEDLGQGLPGQFTVRLPGAVWIIGIALLGAALLLSLHTVRSEQIAVLGGSYALLAFVILSFNGRLERDLFNLSGRYVLPIFSFIVGYSVYLSKSPFQLIQIDRLRKIIIALLSIVHFLSLYSVVETNVDGQSHSIELISIGTGGWWWTGLPLGPNFIVIFGSILFTWFLVNACSSVVAIQIGVIDNLKEKTND
jgi:hypothetical protein